MRRTLRLVAALIVLTAPLSAQAPTPVAVTGMDPARLARIDRVMQAAVDSGKVPGVVTMIFRHGKLAQVGAYGMADREANRRMTPETMFRIASQSKAVTSVAIMMLMEEGRVLLNDPVSRWIPGFARTTVAVARDTLMMGTSGPQRVAAGATTVPARRGITIRDLLTHTAGIDYGYDTLVRPQYNAVGLGPDEGPGWYFADRTVPVCEDIDHLATLPIVAQPGTRYVYGYNTDILGCVVERASGLSLAEFFRTRIFQPLGMKDTYFFLPPEKVSRLAAVYSMRDGQIVRAPDGNAGQGHYVTGPRVSYSGGAGLVSTARDYARFLQMLLNGGQLDGVRLLSPATVRLMTADAADSLYSANAPGRGFSLGFEVLEDPGLAGEYGTPGRFGWGGAYGTNYWADPGDDLVAVYMVQWYGYGNDLPGRFRQLVYSAIVR